MSAYFLVSHQPGVTRIARARLRFRRWFHIIPLKGPSAVQRRRVRKAKGDTQYLRENSYHRGTWYLDGPVKIKKLRRVVTEGTYGRLWASERPCCEKECSACSGRGADGHAHRNCETSEFTRCRQIQVTPAAGSPPTSRGDLAREGDLLGDGARDGDVLAAETNSNETHFVLVKAVGNGATEVPNNYTCPFEEANFSYLGTCDATRDLKPRRCFGHAVRGAQQRRRHSRAVPKFAVGKMAMCRVDVPRRADPARAAAAAASAAPPRPAIHELPRRARKSRSAAPFIRLS